MPNGGLRLVLKKALDKYGFEHRTSGGVIEFDSHEAAIRYQRAKYIAHNVLYVVKQ